MSTTERIFLAQQQARSALRDAYIDLHGLEVKHRRQAASEERRDFYGDVKTGEFATEEAALKIVLAEVTVRQLIDAFTSGVNTQRPNLDPKPFKAYVRLDATVLKGDVIQVQHETPGLTPEMTYYNFRIADVVKAYHEAALAHWITFVPYY